jgi:hypothetical protein
VFYRLRFIIRVHPFSMALKPKILKGGVGKSVEQASVKIIKRR